MRGNSLPCISPRSLGGTPGSRARAVSYTHLDVYKRQAYINAGLTVLFLLVVFSVLFYAIKVGIAAWGKSERTDKETPFEPIPDA